MTPWNNCHRVVLSFSCEMQPFSCEMQQLGVWLINPEVKGTFVRQRQFNNGGDKTCLYSWWCDEWAVAVEPFTLLCSSNQIRNLPPFLQEDSEEGRYRVSREMCQRLCLEEIGGLSMFRMWLMNDAWTWTPYSPSISSIRSHHVPYMCSRSRDIAVCSAFILI
jgi:hypothetical protein